MERYDQYKDSVIEWLGEIPVGWGVRKLKYLANNRPSNVDKKSKDGENSVFLCNYVDVYKNEFIRHGLKFMAATASQDQIENFILNKGDVIVTKDSEAANDIAVPALVIDNFEDVVCGYHLTHIKPIDIIGSYLFRFFQSQFLRSYFEVSANGVTRYGLSVDKFGSALILTPPLHEQTAIANYLDYKTAEIDALISQKERLLELYEEEKAAIINHAVTKGIDPDVELVDSGVEWLGEIPVGWAVKKLKHETYKIGDGIHTTPNYTSGTDFYFINGVNLFDGKITITENTLSVAFDEYEKYKIDLNKGAILISLNGTIGKLAIFDNERVIFGKSAAYIDLKNNVENHFLYYILKSQYVSNYFEDSFSGTTIKNLSLYTLRNLPIPVPHPLVQKLIVSYIESENIRIDAKISKTKRIIELQKEYRSALISEVVTGKVKVPDLASKR
jgi:type I restriction enzyme S subunit